nr:GNAT family N-acetyltransferase [uncultured Ligilactobacillus sp.]
MLKIKKTVNLDQELYKDAVSIREQVFVSEQGIPIELEMQGENGPCYYVGYVNDVPVATVRVVLDGQQWIIQRMAVLPDWRNRHFGSKIIEAIEHDAKENHVNKITLHAQDNAEKFYQKLGYKIQGESFNEVEIPHHVMTKEL